MTYTSHHPNSRPATIKIGGQTIHANAINGR
jgi:hypothetical protein